MEQLRKVVTVGCLTYILYGLISWFQLGTFLPPLPVKPFLFLGFAIFGLVNAVQSGIKLLDISFYLWLVFISVLNQSFLELLLSSPQISSFQESIEVFFQFIAVLLFIWFNALIILSLRKINYNFTLYFLVLIGLVVMIFIFPNYISLQKSAVIIGLLYFLTNTFSQNSLENSVERTVVVLTGVAIIELIEWIILFQ